MSPNPSPSPDCPFCRIASTYPPLPFHQNDQKAPTPSPNHDQPGTNAHLILSTPSILAFLDIMPLTRGHVLVTTRHHYGKLGDLDISTAREIGQWLPVLSRVVMRTIFGDDDADGAHWNVVQNNGIRAAQQVPHLHFHIVPRPEVDSSSGGSLGRGTGRASYVMFGRGQRDELDDEDGDELAGLLRMELAREVKRVRDVEGVDLSDPDAVKGKL